MALRKVHRASAAKAKNRIIFQPGCFALNAIHEDRSSPMRNLLCLSLLCVLLLLALPALAQEATVVGTVTDATGAAVPNVSITITNAETGIARQLTTNDVG